MISLTFLSSTPYTLHHPYLEMSHVSLGIILLALRWRQSSLFGCGSRAASHVPFRTTYLDHLHAASSQGRPRVL